MKHVRNECKILVEKCGWKKFPVNLKSDGNTKMNFKEIVWGGGVDVHASSLGRDRWRDFLNTVIGVL